MEDHSLVDISIRNVAVRLNDTSVSEMNGGCVYIPSSHEKDKASCEQNCSSDHPDIADDLRDKLQVCQNSKCCGLLNGCNKTLREDFKLAINGVNKCCSIGLSNNQLNNRTDLEQPSVNYRTESKSSDSNKSGDTATLPANTPSQESDLAYCDQSSQSIAAPIIESETLSIRYLGYESELQMPDIMRLIQKDLSEPYSIYTYRYFIHNWPKLCFLAQDGDLCVGAIVCKLDVHKKQSRRGYIAMLAVDEKYRKRKIGSNLVLKAIQAMVQDNADEVVLETEITNKSALRLYENLGFVRDKRLFRYYLNGVDALRLKLWLR